jgi:hypothetical protein
MDPVEPKCALVSVALLKWDVEEWPANPADLDPDIAELLK